MGTGMTLTANRLRELLCYDPETGNFSRAKTGKRAGWLDVHGYRRVSIGGVKYYAHRLAWLYMTGEWPSNEIDHTNTDRSDNRWANLRVASSSDNKGNRRCQKNNSSGFKGVYWASHASRWRAEIKRGPKRYRLGYFPTRLAAAAAYEAAANKLFGEFARTA